MSSSASLLLLYLGATHPSGAVALAGVPTGLAERVADAVGSLWRVEPDSVRLEWGTTTALTRLPEETSFRLLGDGNGGWFAVVFEPEGRAPVAARLRAGIAVVRLVATRALKPGARLTTDVVREQIGVRWGPPSISSEQSVAEGWVVRRGVSEGETLEPPVVAPPPLVEAGQPVRVVWSGGAVSIAIDGIALNSAALGEPVRVRKASGLGILRGTVTGPALARMEQP